ncbi:metallophosphoesterase [Rhodovulum marinum]|uniref:metallophosphoesterase n=1 Tax=Rhodovulum marinum TaxID=320662 RepID=UPI0010433264|nr:metallophosphoesterase [Rhodovulum marinum]
MRSYAIGDVHGQHAKLVGAHELIAADRARTGDAEAPVVHLGDYVDRGPDSKAVLDILIAGLADGAPWILLKGNHDDMMRDFLDPIVPSGEAARWLTDKVGGRQTLASYGVSVASLRAADRLRKEACKTVPSGHRDLLETLRPSYRRGEVFFCHAGIRPGIPLDDQSERDLIWIRDEFLLDPRDHGALIVHGHTPGERVVHCGNRVNLDTGAGYGGPVSVVVIEGRAVWQLTPDGRVPVRDVR